jgi:hypothetical protein
MSWPDPSKTLELLEQWQSMHRRTSELMASIDAVFGGQPESLIHETTWALFEAYTGQLSERIGDSSTPGSMSWLSWFCYENEMGRKGMKAGLNGVQRPLRTLDDLHLLIIEWRESA